MSWLQWDALYYICLQKTRWKKDKKETWIYDVIYTMSSSQSPKKQKKNQQDTLIYFFWIIDKQNHPNLSFWKEKLFLYGFII